MRNNDSKQTNDTKKAIIALCIANLIWGSTFVVVKESVALVDTFLIAFVRCGIAALLLGLYIVIKDVKLLTDTISIKLGTVLGIFLGVVYTSQAYGLEFTSSSHSAFITVSSTILTPVVLTLFYKTREHWKGWLTIATVFLGIYLLTFKSDGNDTDSSMMFGDFITFLAAIVCAFQLIYSGKYVHKASFLPLIFYQFLVGAIFGITGFQFRTEASFTFPEDSIYYISYLGLFGTLYCYFVTVWAQKYVSTITTAMIFSMEPIFASTFAYLHFGEVFGLKELAGASLILLGVIAYQTKHRWLVRFN